MDLKDLTLTHALLAAVTAMAGVVAVLFQQLRATDARQQKEMDECKADRARFWDFVLKLNTSELRSKINDENS